MTEEEPQRSRDLNRAVNSYQTSVELEPAGEAFYGLSLALFDLGRIQEASEAVEKALAIGSPVPDIFTQKATILCWKRNDLLKEIELTNTGNRGQSHELKMRLKQLEREIETYYFTALQHSDNYSDGWNNLGVYYFTV
jgi:tetratricopeptide (TPR) repeat protein